MTIFVLHFEKMNGLGNDFIMLERRHMPNGADEKSLAKLLCDRHFNVGADGIIIVDFPNSTDADFVWSYYNSDGSEAEMCGNGMRCFAKYVYERGLTDNNSFSVLTKAGIIRPTIEDDGTVTVDMGTPKYDSNLNGQLTINSRVFNYTYIEIGNPHCVIFLENELSNDDFCNYGPKIEKSEKFPNKINVEFVKILNKEKIKCRVWERGCGPTLACGTGACAALVAANLSNYSNNKAQVELPGGILNIWWDKALNHVFLNGPAQSSFIGQFNLDPRFVCKST